MIFVERMNEQMNQCRSGDAGVKAMKKWIQILFAPTPTSLLKSHSPPPLFITFSQPIKLLAKHIRTVGTTESEDPVATSNVAWMWSSFFHQSVIDFPGGTGSKEHTCQYRRHKRLRFHPWVWKIPRRRAWRPTLVFFPEESHGQKSLGYSP